MCTDERRRSGVLIRIALCLSGIATLGWAAAILLGLAHLARRLVALLMA